MAAVKRKKLVFLADFATATASPVFRVFPCTQFRASYAGDMWGNVLQDLAPLTVGTDGRIKQLNDVTAWVRPVRTNPSGAGATHFLNQYDLVFCNATTIATSAAATILQTALIKTSQSVNGAVTGGVLGVDGVTPILTRHFAVRVERVSGSIASTGAVMVYVQRQHSIEV